MDYEKAYKEALERAKSFQEKYGGDYAGYIFPELRDSEDERIRKKMIEHFKSKTKDTWCNMPVKSILAWLEKQKEPVVNGTGLYYYDGEKFTYCGYPATEENPYDFAMSQQEEKKKEPHFTKRNALFDKCVENCDPNTVEEVNKRVDDIMNMSELSAFEQALTNFIGYWEDDEERWPSKFVKKHGKHILDMARDELQKEQIPYIDFVIKPHRGDDTNPYDMSVSEAQEYAIKRGFGVPFNDGEVYVDERHITQTIGNILRWADEHPKEQKPIQTDAEKEYVRTLKSLVADFVRANNYIERGYYQQIYDWLDGRHIEQKPVEIHIDNPNIQRFDPDVKVTTSDSSASGKELLYVSNKSYKIGYRDGVNSVKPAEWSEEDEKIITRLISYFESFRIAGVATKWEGLDIQEVITLLKSLRPSWKPTEEQMKCLLNAEGLIRTDKRLAMAQKLAELYEQLKKLM